MFVRLFVDENLDRHVPISKQPKEKIQVSKLSQQIVARDFLSSVLSSLAESDSALSQGN
jgi:hypothetical protein